MPGGTCEIHLFPNIRVISTDVSRVVLGAGSTVLKELGTEGLCNAGAYVPVGGDIKNKHYQSVRCP